MEKELTIISDIFKKFSISENGKRVYDKRQIEKEIKEFQNNKGKTMGELNHPDYN